MSSLLKWAVVFGIIAVIAAVFGFGGVAAGAADIAQILFFVFLGLVILFVILGLFVPKKVT